MRNNSHFIASELEKCSEQSQYHDRLPELYFAIPVSVLKVSVGSIGLWLNYSILKEYRVVRTQQIVNTLAFYICLACLSLSGLHTLEGLR